MDTDNLQTEFNRIRARIYWYHHVHEAPECIIARTQEEAEETADNPDYKEVTADGDTLRSFLEKWDSARRIVQGEEWASEMEARDKQRAADDRARRTEAGQQKSYDKWRYRFRILAGPEPDKWCFVTKTSLDREQKPVRNAVPFECRVSSDGEDTVGYSQQLWFIPMPSFDALVKLSRAMRNPVIVDYDGVYTSIEIYDDYRE